MKKSLFDTDAPHSEASSLTAFSRNELNRIAEHRDENCLEQALKVEGAHIFALSAGHLVLKHDNQVLDPLFAPYELAELAPRFDDAVLLGYQPGGEPRLAVPVGATPEELAQNYKVADARSLYRDQLVADEFMGEVAQALSLVQWNRDSRFCGRCGGTMEARIGGYKRVCLACDHTIFPRTDPVVIMLAVDEKTDRCLLGRNHRFPEGMYSCLAGFMEPGETVESAVRRETQEESGVEIGRVRYHASQPWPMPHQLMIGCFAEALTDRIVLDAAELADCRWFERSEVSAMLSASSENKSAPLKGAIAHRLMADWLDWS